MFGMEKHLQEYSISKVATNQWRLNKLTKNIPIPPHVLIDAEKYATLEMASWISPSLWRALAKDNAHVERLLKYFSEGAEKDIVLSAINQLVTEEPFIQNLSMNVFSITFSYRWATSSLILNAKA